MHTRGPGSVGLAPTKTSPSSPRTSLELFSTILRARPLVLRHYGLPRYSTHYFKADRDRPSLPEVETVRNASHSSKRPLPEA